MSKEQSDIYQREFVTLTARVLLVDDEPDFLEQLASRLKIRGASVDTALNCEEALKKIEDHEFDAIVVDLSMPGVDGLETTKRIKSIHPSSEIIILTGYGSIQSSVTAMKIGASDFLEKPVEMNSLVEKIRQAKRAHRQASKAETIVQLKKYSTVKAGRGNLELNVMGRNMKIDISVVREILIPLPEYPHITAQKPISDAIALLLRHNSGNGCHMHYEEILVTDDNGKLIGQLRLESILENFFSPALRPSASKAFYEDSEQFADLILIIDDWFKAECKSLMTITVEKYMCRHPYSINASAHVVHALGMMLTGQRKVLPVIEDNVLQGAIRMEDIFKILGTRALPCLHST